MSDSFQAQLLEEISEKNRKLDDLEDEILYTKKSLLIEQLEVTNLIQQLEDRQFVIDNLNQELEDLKHEKVSFSLYVNTFSDVFVTALPQLLLHVVLRFSKCIF